MDNLLFDILKVVSCFDDIFVVGIDEEDYFCMFFLVLEWFLMVGFRLNKVKCKFL